MTANFEINVYTILAAPNDEAFGTVAGSGDYEHFQMVELTATPNTGYHLVKWTENGEVVMDGDAPAGEVYTFIAEEARDLVANFAINAYVITATASEGGTIDPEGDIVVDHGASQLFTIAPDDGYVITNVLVDGHNVGAVDHYEFVNVIYNHTITAEFEIEDETGIENIVDKVSVYPNPFDHTVTISNAAGLTRLVIKNIFGQSVFEKILDGSDELIITAESFTPGVYIFTLTGSDNSTRVLKMIKE